MIVTVGPAIVETVIPEVMVDSSMLPSSKALLLATALYVSPDLDAQPQ